MGEVRCRSDAASANPFPAPSSLEKVLLQELVQVAKSCYDRGWSFGTAGNFSLRGQRGVIWQSPSGLNKGQLDPHLFIPVDLQSTKVIDPQAPRPSQEMPVHLGVYRAIPEAMAVVHTHPPHVVRRCRPGLTALCFQGEEMQKHLGCAHHQELLRIPVLSNPRPVDMPAMIDQVGSHRIPGVPMVLLATHGVYAWGRTPMEALSFIEAVEYLAMTAAPTS